MPRNYVKRNLRAQWSLKNLQAAIRDIREQKGSIREISRTYNVPVRTLMRRMKTNDMEASKLGRKSTLGKENEEKLVDYIKQLEKCNFPATMHDIQILAYKFVITNGIANRFNDVKKVAGYDWVTGFLKRHPEIAIRKAQGLSIARMKGMNKQEVNDYFVLLKNIFDEHGFYSFPRKIYNTDETGVQLNNPPDKVLASKGAKAVCSLTSAEKGETITVLTCVNAEGHFLPPYCIFKGKNKKPEFEDGLPPGGQVIMNEISAYVTSAIFLKWLQNMFVPRKDPGKVLLILDGHSSHVSDPDVLDYAAKNDVILMCLPSHTTHYLQPLDRSFFKPLKTYWRDACGSWMRNNADRKLTRYQFPSLINTAWSKAATVQNGVSGFKACGIYPLNESIIPEYAFRYDENESTTATTAPVLSAAATASSSLTTTPPVVSEEISSAPELTTASQNQEITIRPSPLTAPVELENIAAIPSTSFYDIQRIPTISHPTGRASSRKQHAQILTSPDVIAAKRTKKEQKKVSAEKRSRNAAKKKSQRAKTKTTPKPTVVQKGKREKLRKRIESSSSCSSSVEMSIHSTDDYDDIIDESEYCKRCNGYYFDKKGPKCDWLQCLKCLRWVHEICTSSASFCEDCSP